MRDQDFREFVTSASPALSRSAYLLTGDHHLAEDLLQSALANAYRHWRRIREGNPIAYVRRAMHHEQISWWRRRRLPELPVADLPETPDVAVDSAQQTVERLAVAQALRELSPRQRAVLVLRFYEDLTEAETARVLGLTVGTVKRHGHDGLARLRESLQAQATQARTYDVTDRAVATAKRRRLNRLGSIAGAIAALLTLLLSGLPAWLAAQMLEPAHRTGVPSIPDRVAAPPRYHPTAENAPVGPASVLFGGTGWHRLSDLDNEGDLAVVGAHADEYRIIHGGYEVHAGTDVVLSPDGSMVAQQSGMDPRGFGVLDLRTGEVKFATRFDLGDPVTGTPGDYITPMAWSRDSKTIAIHVRDDHEQVYFALYDVASGEVTRIDGPIAGMRGYGFAFSPDGTRFAYREWRMVRVRGMDLSRQSVFEIPDGAELAGKGAWSPDGRAIALLTQVPGGWELALHDITDGRRLDGRVWTVKQDHAAIRLVGWSPAGNPVVVAHVQESWDRDRGLDTISYNSTHSANVLELTPDGPRALLTAPRNIMSIDVAEDAIATGVVRPAQPPTWGLLSAGTLVAGLASLAVVVMWLRRRWLLRGLR